MATGSCKAQLKKKGGALGGRVCVSEKERVFSYQVSCSTVKGKWLSGIATRRLTDIWQESTKCTYASPHEVVSATVSVTHSHDDTWQRKRLSYFILKY